MGQCVSCSANKRRYRASHKHSKPFRPMDKVSLEEEKILTKRATPYTRGQATLFGFKRQPVATKTLDNHDRLVQSKQATPPSLTSDDVQNSVRTNRFGFKGPHSSATNKVADTNKNTILVSSPQEACHRSSDSEISHTVKSSKRGDMKTISATAPKMKGLLNTLPETGATYKLSQSGIPQPTGHPQATKFTLQSSLLPRPQFPIRLACADTDVNNVKTAKTAVNITRKNCDSHGANLEMPNRQHVDKDANAVLKVQQLDSSPTFGYHRRHEKRRILGTVITGQKFDVRDLKEPDLEDPTVITEISVIKIPSSNVKSTQNTGMVRERALQLQSKKQAFPHGRSDLEETFSARSLSDEYDSFPNKESNEEKVFQDRSNSEKAVENKAFSNEAAADDDWGHGEAMAEGYSSSGDDSPDSSSVINHVENIKKVASPKKQTNDTKHRPVMLLIEDSRFAAIAASASCSLIEDEKSPVDSIFSGSPPTTSISEDISKEQESILKQENKRPSESPSAVDGVQASGSTISPISPDTPSNASNSLSLSDGRDFLIDDEIADQPGLLFTDANSSSQVGCDATLSSGGCSSQQHSMIDNTLVETCSKPVPKCGGLSVEGSPLQHRKSSAASVGTLSPCESLASDDLMLDYESSKSSLDCVAESIHDTLLDGIDNLNEDDIINEITFNKESILREWNSLINSGPKELGLPNVRSRYLRTRPNSGPLSAPESPRLLDSKRSQNSPLRPPRQLAASESEDGGVRLDRCTYQMMFQDIVNIKTMLHKLKRVLHENEESGVSKAETLNPFDVSVKNDLLLTLADDCSESSTRSLEDITDLRHQLAILQQQNEEKERTIKLLQVQMTKYVRMSDEPGKCGATDTCNAATQTERVRPMSAGPSLLQSLPTENVGSLVSSSDTWNHRRETSAGDVTTVTRTLSKLPSANPKSWKKNNPTSSPEQSKKITASPSSASLLRKVTVNGNTKPQNRS